MPDDLIFQSATTLGKALESGGLTAKDIAEAFITRTQEVDTKIRAFLSFDPEDLLTQAKASDERRARGQVRGPLEGIPVGLKDILAEKGKRLSCASRMLEHFVSPYDATSVLKLREAGALTWGRLNMDEFAMGSSTEHSAFACTANPWNLDCVPGGSSGGSAAAVAAAEAPLSLGTDTGGSIRQPAAFCGVVGMKPTYGLVSRYGLVAFASSLDQVGPFARTVEDAALLLQAVAGHDRLDSTSYRINIPDYRMALTREEGPWKIGIPREYFAEGLSETVRTHIEEVMAFYKERGCELIEVSLPHTELAVPVYYIIAPAEASSNLARYDGVRYTHRSSEAKDLMGLYCKSRAEGFGAEVKRRITLGSYVLSSGYYDAYYLKAQKVRALIREDFMRIFEQVDALLTPTSPTVAFKAGEHTGDPLAMYLSDIFTISANLAGLPALSMPCGFSDDNLPIGAQLIGKPFEEASLLTIAHAYDREHHFGLRHPEL